MKYSAINSTSTIRTFINSTRKKGYLHLGFILILFSLFLLLTACEDSFTPVNSSPVAVSGGMDAAANHFGTSDASYAFSGPVFDIAATPNGSILVAETVSPGNEPADGRSTSIIKEIRKGTVRKVVEIQTIKGSPINGLAAVGRRSFYATSGALDRATGGKLFHVRANGARAVADIGAFERNNDPDANFGLGWKNPKCEAAGPFDAGPQSNPYHLTMLSGSTALVADAAGNTLLAVKRNGEIELVAVFTPPTANGSGSTNSADWLVFPNTKDDEIPVGVDCYVQPVPTSVAIGPDGAYYVGELVGAGSGGLPVVGASRVWRIEPGAREVMCPSSACKVVLSGFTSILDLAFGPDGNLFVVEYAEAGWLAPFIPAFPDGGTINSCDVGKGLCSEVAHPTLPSAITFDKRGNLWVLENNLSAPTVHRVGLR